ncbi:ubiquitin-like protein Pup, partial [Actinomyces denticolens]
GLRARSGTDWNDPRLAALDITWGDLRAGSIIDRLDAAGRVRRLLDPSRIEAAADTPPAGTRAAVRGRAIATIPEVVRLLDQSRHRCSPAPPAHPSRPAGAVAVTEAETEGLLTAIGRAAKVGETGPSDRPSLPTHPPQPSGQREGTTMTSQDAQQIRPSGGEGDTESETVGAAGRVQTTGVDAILDEIDSVLETNAAAFVQGFVQKGGQ